VEISITLVPKKGVLINQQLNNSTQKNFLQDGHLPWSFPDASSLIYDDVLLAHLGFFMDIWVENEGIAAHLTEITEGPAVPEPST